MPERFDKESIYDEQIYPLMDQIIAICKEHQIPLVASFLLKSPDENGDDLRVNTALFYEYAPDDFKRMHAIGRYGSNPSSYAMTVSRQEER